MNVLEELKVAIIKMESKIIFFDKSFYWRCLSVSHHPVWTGSVMFRKRVDQYFREDVNYAEDHDFWWRLTKKNTPMFINEPLSVYQRCSSTLTKNYNVEWYASTVKVYSELVSDENLLVKSSLSMILSDLCFEAGYGYRESRKYRSAMQLLLKAIYWDVLNLKAWRSLIASMIAVVMNMRA